MRKLEDDLLSAVDLLTVPSVLLSTYMDGFQVRCTKETPLEPHRGMKRAEWCIASADI